MTQISRDVVVHLAELSKLQLTEEETESLRVDIANILEYVDKLNELDTSHVEPRYQVIDVENIWRDDVVRDSGISREQLLGLASEAADNQIKVPKVL